MVTIQDFVRVCAAVTLIHALLVCASGESPRQGNLHLNSSYAPQYPEGPLGNAPIDIPDEKKIIRDLLLLYEKRGIDGRPVRNSSRPVYVKFSIQLIQIMDLDEKNQVLKLSVWDRYEWKDEYLVWDPAQYGGVDNVRIHQDKVWKPDFKLYNYADERTEEHREALVVVNSTGALVWMPQVIYKSSCAIDISHFPFDEQECVLKFGSWTYDGHKLDVNFLNNLTKIDLSEYMPSNAWEIIEAPARRNVVYYSCCPEPFLDLTFTLKVRRRSAFYNYILILPCILLSTLTLVLFWIPPESPAKMALGINIFVAFFLLLVILESSLPSASTVPLLGIYYCFNMVIITLSSFLNVLVVNMAFYGPRGEVPQFLKTLAFEIFARIFFMNRLVGNVTDPDKQTKHSSENSTRTTANGNHFVGVDSETNWLADGWREAHEASKSIISGGPGGHSHIPGSCCRGLHHRGGHGPGIYHTPSSGSGTVGRSHTSGGVFQGTGCASGGHTHGGHSHTGGLPYGSHAHAHHTHAHTHSHGHSHPGGGHSHSGGGSGHGPSGGSGSHGHSHAHTSGHGHIHGHTHGGGGGGSGVYQSGGHVIYRETLAGIEGHGSSGGGGGAGGGGRSSGAGHSVRTHSGGGSGGGGGGGGSSGGGGGSSIGSSSISGGAADGGAACVATGGSGSCESLMKRKELIQIERDVKAIRKFVTESMYRLAEADRKEKLAREWKAVALIFDRLFFIFYVVIISISLVVVPVTLRAGIGKK